MATPYTYDQIIKALKAEGLVVHEYTGARDRCRCHTGSHAAGGTKVRPWGPFYGTYTHITAGNLGTRTVEQYIRDIINGDPNVPCKAQFVVPPDGSVWVNSVGRANHAGTVSSTSISMQQAASFSFDKTYDPHRGHDADGNTHSYGIEAIAASAMNAAQREACVRINAALARPQGWDGGESVGHGECSDQRSYADPGLDMGAFRRDVRARITGGSTTDVTSPAPVVEPTTEPVPEPTPEVPVTKVSILHWNIAGSDSTNGYGASNSYRGDDLGRYALSIGFDVFVTCEASQDNLRNGVSSGLGAIGATEWMQRAKAIWYRATTVKNFSARKAYYDNLYAYLSTRKWGAAFFGIKDGIKFSVLEIHTDYRAPAKQAKQVQTIFKKWRADTDALGIKHANTFVCGDFNWDGTSGDDPFHALDGWNFEEKGSRTVTTFMERKHLDGVLAHKSADVSVSVKSRSDGNMRLSDHNPVKFVATLQ